MSNSKLDEKKVLVKAEQLRVAKNKERIKRRGDAVQDSVLAKQAKEATVLLTNAQVDLKKHKANLELSLMEADQAEVKKKAIKAKLDEIVKYNRDPNSSIFDKIMKKISESGGNAADFLSGAKTAVKDAMANKPKVPDAPAMVSELSTQEKVEQAEATVEIDDKILEQKKNKEREVQLAKLAAEEKSKLQSATARAANKAKIAKLSAELKQDQLNAGVATPGVAIADATADATGKEAKSEARKENSEEKPAAKEQKPAAKEQKPTQEKPAANKKPTVKEEKPKLRE